MAIKAVIPRTAIQSSNPGKKPSSLSSFEEELDVGGSVVVVVVGVLVVVVVVEVVDH